MSLAVEIQGHIYRILELKEIQSKSTGNTFRFREVVLKATRDVNGNLYDEFIPIKFINNNIDRIKHIKVGDEVKIKCNIGGRMWTDKENNDRFFSSLTGWYVENLGQQNTAQQPFNDHPANSSEFNEEPPSSDPDLPF